MTVSTFRYDRRFDPPAPVVGFRIGSPGGVDAVLLPGLLDTGADATLVPARIARRLDLPQVDVARLTGVTGTARSVAVLAARIELPGFSTLARVIGFADEAILGRDLLNAWVATLDGPRGLLSIRTRPTPR
jgi:predicted aspartyl protease